MAHKIVLMDGGRFSAGTDSSPFRHHLNITLLGERGESTEMPTFGTKVLAVDGGTLELHGQTASSWLRLGTTAHAGSNQLILEEPPADWDPGARILVASTDFDPHQAEERTIAKVNGTSVLLTEPLSFTHYGEIQYFGGKALDERAEVGLLTKNILIQGDATSDATEFGCQVMARAGELRLSNVEVKNCGQRSSLARYPVHFHMIGNAPGCYVRNCSIHRNYNRAVALHGVHSAQLQDNVIFDTKGHAIFVEDAIESGNLLHRNLVCLTKKATSLLQTDQTPAAFWVGRIQVQQLTQIYTILTAV
jgi:cell migration-inducing and hyaluronan-binding protein